MDWAALLLAIVKVVAWVTDYLGNRRLMQQAQAEILSKHLAEAIANIEKANEAAAAVSDPHSPYAKLLRQRFERQGDE